MATPNYIEPHGNPPPTSSTRGLPGIENPYLAPEGPNLDSTKPNEFIETVNELGENCEPDNDADDI